MSSDNDQNSKRLIPKPRILVCAPSNAGVDEIIQRVMEVGLMDGNKRRYNPDIIRIGRQTNMRRTIGDHLSLDVMIEVAISTLLI
jgi:senataxin